MAASNPADDNKCQWIDEMAALTRFALYEGATQSQWHIKPLHWYVACRLVLEGGFEPDEITPRPPLEVEKKSGHFHLRYTPASAGSGESAILGGLKTKNVDVVVAKPGIGPVLAISCKGMTKAFRNLTNRMEETIGECTNLHITYPAMVFGYVFVIRANRRAGAVVAEVQGGPDSSARQLALNDIAINESGTTVESILRFRTVLEELTGRRGIRNDVSRYEAVALAMVEVAGENVGNVSKAFPASDSPLRFERFFEQLYRRYGERYVFGAPELKGVTSRRVWIPDTTIAETPPCQETAYKIRME